MFKLHAKEKQAMRRGSQLRAMVRQKRLQTWLQKETQNCIYLKKCSKKAQQAQVCRHVMQIWGKWKFEECNMRAAAGIVVFLMFNGTMEVSAMHQAPRCFVYAVRGTCDCVRTRDCVRPERRT
jgi:hypothetical protein